mmetsp:Transcript_149479/g.478940  ORF Transcript_149479/g.478940 Transcript_149479/m.478940 type:complete len:578 (-) Transcript_149479:63-1796(-)
MAVLAQELEWPQWFVDLRHEATHMRLPSLHVLRCAAKEAVFLLFERFWRPQQECLERRGRGRIQRLGQPTSSTPRVRDRQLVDRRLRALVSLTGRKRKQPEPLAATAGSESMPSDAGELVSEHSAAAMLGAMTAAEEVAVTVAHGLAALAVDEARVLERVLATTLAGRPSHDGREARAVQLLCAESSDNFALRLAREVATKALGWSAGVVLEPASDSRPSLRNISDVSASDWSKDGAEGGDDGVGTIVDEVEADRMLCWLEALLSTPGRSGGDPHEAPFATALRSLAPWLRRAAMRRVVTAASAAASGAAALQAHLGPPPQMLASRAARVWEALDAHGVDAGARHFAKLCSGTAFLGQHQEPQDQNSGSAQPVLEEVEAFLCARKAKRASAGTAEAAGVGAAERGTGGIGGAAVTQAREPWTAVGTFLDPRTLAVCCASERPPATARPARRGAPEESQSVHDEVTAAADLWRAWGSSLPSASAPAASAAASARARGSGPSSSRMTEAAAAAAARAAPPGGAAPTPSVDPFAKAEVEEDDGAVAAAKQVAGGAEDAEASFRALATSLFEGGLRPFGSE